MAKGYRGNKLDPSKAVALRDIARKTWWSCPGAAIQPKVMESFRYSDARNDWGFFRGLIGLTRSLAIGMAIPLALRPPP